MSHDAFSIDFKTEDSALTERALQTEWLLTNGIGGYAMGTALGVNSRRYHGLLVAALKPPVERIVALHSTIEQLIIGDEIIDLSTQQFGDGLMLHPDGWRRLVSFRCEPNKCVEWMYRVRSLSITKRLTMLANHNGVTLQYVVNGGRQPCTLRVRPFTPMRDFHGVMHDAQSQCVADVEHFGVVRFHHSESEMRCFGQSHAWRNDPQLWRQFGYAHDRNRGQDFQEDLFSAGMYECDIPSSGESRISFAIAMGHTGLTPTRMNSNHPPATAFEQAAAQFIVQRKVGDAWSTSILAGYPWFGDWGRDTMISLPGLMLCTGRHADAQATLLTFAKHLRNGLIPNLFDDYGGAAHYNTVDASLWFVHAVHELWKLNKAMVSGELLDACRTIVHAYRSGTDFNIHMDDDGLIIAGDESTQLTWMDAKRDGVVFTPRHGKAVEINALWFNALCSIAEMSGVESEHQELLSLSERVAEAFGSQFWWEQRQCLYDVIGNHQLRPNQIFAASLPFSPLSEDQQRAVVQTVGGRLLTPFGLRTLDRDDPEYRGRHEGNLFERDRAYHNGTVWPWLIGPYCEALLRCNQFSARAKHHVQRALQPLLEEMRATNGGCVNQLAEIYDGDAPHRRSGCPAQAWSVAEVLRISTMITL